MDEPAQEQSDSMKGCGPLGTEVPHEGTSSLGTGVPIEQSETTVEQLMRRYVEMPPAEQYQQLMAFLVTKALADTMDDKNSIDIVRELGKDVRFNKALEAGKIDENDPY